MLATARAASASIFLKCTLCQESRESHCAARNTASRQMATLRDMAGAGTCRKKDMVFFPCRPPPFRESSRGSRHLITFIIHNIHNIFNIHIHVHVHCSACATLPDKAKLALQFVRCPRRSALCDWPGGCLFWKGSSLWGGGPVRGGLKECQRRINFRNRSVHYCSAVTGQSPSA